MGATAGSGSADSFAPAPCLGLVSVTFTASMLALLSKSVHSMDRKFSYTTLLAISICIIATLFVAIISAFAVGSCVNLSQEICRVAYILCAAFWLVGKGLLYLWYTEKLHMHRNFTGLEKTRWNVFYLINHILVCAPYTLALVWIFGAFNATASLGECDLAIEYEPAACYLLAYTAILACYISASFLWPFPCLRCGWLLRPLRSLSRSLAAPTSSRFPCHPAVRLAPNRRQRSAYQRKACLHAALNLLASAVPITTLAVLMRHHRQQQQRAPPPPPGKPWWFFASATAVDLVIACAVTAMLTFWEARNQPPPPHTPEPTRLAAMAIAAATGWGTPALTGTGTGGRAKTRNLCDECTRRGTRGSGIAGWFGGEGFGW